MNLMYLMNLKRILIVIILIIIFIFLYSCFLKNNAVVKINNAKFKVELAQTPQERYQGLSNREELKSNKGMLFLFDDYKKRTFIMRDMKFPLDIVWIKDDTVLQCDKNVQILASDGSFTLINTKYDINIVLEINAGKCDEFDIKQGDIVDINLKQ